MNHEENHANTDALLSSDIRKEEKERASLLSVGGRLKQLRGSKTQDEFAETVGVSKRTYQRYETDEREPDASQLKTICDRYDISPTWLLLGVGPMRMEEEAEEHPEVPRSEGAAPLPPPGASDIMEGVVMGVERALIGRPNALTVEKKARLITVLYDLFRRVGKPDEATVKRVVDMVID